MKNTFVVVAALLAATGCGAETLAEEDSGDPSPEGAENVGVSESAIVGLSPSSNVAALWDRHLKNQGGTNVCAYSNGQYLNTQTCNTSTSGSQVFSIYQVKNNGKYIVCSKDMLWEQNGQVPCTKSFYSTSGVLQKTEIGTCNLLKLSGACLTTGSGTDVRMYGAVISSNTMEWYYGNGSFAGYEQRFYGGVLRWLTPDPNITFAAQPGLLLKANNGKYLARDSNIVRALSLNASDANFKWSLY